jgi:signal transduction histidine kinase/CheY-like chemotaxis protein/PAS domain-containing protein
MAEHEKEEIYSGMDVGEVLRNLPVGVSTSVIRDGKILSHSESPQFRSLLGIAPDCSLEDEYRIIRSKIHPDDLEKAVSLHRGMVSSGRDIRYSFRYFPDGGSMRWYSSYVRSVEGPSGTFTVYSALTDITQEKRMEADLTRSRKMYEVSAEMAGLCVWNYDIVTHTVLMSDNPATRILCQRYRIPQTLENVPECEKKWIAEEDYERYCSMYRALDRGVKKASCEYWYKPDIYGNARCERVTYTMVYDENGKPVYACGIGQDITARRNEEQNYRRWYRQMAEANPDSVCFFRMNLTTNWCGGGQSKFPFYLTLQNAGTADGFFAASAGSIIDDGCHRTFQEIFSRNHLLSSFHAGKSNVELEYPIRTPEGAYCWLRGVVHMVRNPETGDIEAMVSAVDITDQKENEQIIRRITCDSHDFIGIVETDTGLLSLRQGIWEMKGVSDRRKNDYQETMTAFARKYVAAAEKERFIRDLAMDSLRRRLSSEGQFSCTYTLVRTEGKQQKKQLQIGWLGETEDKIIFVQTDITKSYEEEQERMRQLQEALRHAEDASRAKTDFVSRISHDIRTPISAITSMTEFALADIGNTEKLRDDLMKIRTSNGFLLSLINDILDISKIDSGQIELHPEPYVYRECVQSIVDVFEPVCREKKIRFEVTSDESDAVPCADRIRINQIVLNIISNAVKYTPAGGSVQVHFWCTRQDNGMDAGGFEVRDSGIGMSEGFQKIMFEPFTQDDENPERVKLAGGTGLGLSIVRRLIDLMGGTLEVKSRIGEGTCVTVHLMFPESSGSRPAVPDTALPAASDAAQNKEPLSGTVLPQQEKEPLSGTVLLAEDNAINTEIIVRLLEETGLRTDSVPNGKEAVEKFRNSGPGEYCCILMDLRMPVMNGFEATEKIRALDHPSARTVPIIALTADAITETKERSGSSGMNAYLTKPIDTQQLYATLGA